jgi:hypothetical protein
MRVDTIGSVGWSLLAGRSPNRFALAKRISSYLGKALRFGIAADRRPSKMLAEDVNRALASLQGKEFGR